MHLVVCVVITLVQLTNYVHVPHSLSRSFVQLYQINSTIFVCNLLNRSSVTYTYARIILPNGIERKTEWEGTRNRWCENEWAELRSRKMLTPIYSSKDKTRKKQRQQHWEENEKCAALVWTKARNVRAPITQRTEMKLLRIHLYIYISSHRFFLYGFFVFVFIILDNSLHTFILSFSCSFVTVFMFSVFVCFPPRKRTNLRKMLLFQFTNKTVCFRFSIWFYTTS